MTSSTRKPVWLTVVALVVILAWLGIGGIGGRQIGGLSGLQKNENTLNADAESVIAHERAKAFGDASQLPLFVLAVGESGKKLDPALLAQVVKDLPSTKVSTGGTVGDLLNGPIIPVPKGDAILLNLPMERSKITQKVDDKSILTHVVDAVGEGVKPLKDAGYTVYRTGPAGLISDLSGAFAGIDGILLVVALIVVFLILILVYRSPLLPLAVLMSAVFGLSAAGMIVFPLARSEVLTVSGQSQGILSILVVGAATDYALLLVARYREELHTYASSWQAMKVAWKATLEPIAASAGTVVAGLLCLTLSGVPATRSLGPIAALGIVGAFFSSLTFLPAVLLLGGRTMFWPKRPKVGDVDTNHHGGWSKLANWVGRHPRSVWLTTALVLLACSLGALVYRADGLSTQDFFRKPVESVQGQTELNKLFPGNGQAELNIVVPQDKVQQVTDALRDVKGVTKIEQTMTRPNPQAPQVPPAPKVVDGKVEMQVHISGGMMGKESRATTADVRTAAKAIDADLKVGGVAADSADFFSANQKDLLIVLPAILFVVFLVLVLVLRSLMAPLILIGANILSFVATLGISALVFNDGFGFANSEPSTPLYAFVFLVALGIDYSIFLMTRVREETGKFGTRKAVTLGLALTGGVITSAGIVLAATFSALFVIPLVFMAQIAFFVAFGVLLDTFVVRSLLVPGLIHDIGRFSWWPSRLDRSTPKSVAPAADADTAGDVGSRT